MPFLALFGNPVVRYGLLAIGISLGLWWLHHHVWQQGYDARVTEDQAAQAALNAKASKAGTDAITGVLKSNENDSAAVNSASNGILRVCSSEVRNSPSSGLPDAAAREAEIRRTLQDAADDIRTCQAELNRFAGLQNWVIGIQK